jgi:hypothetical protein
MHARQAWKLGLCLCSAAAGAACREEERPTPAPPVVVREGDSLSLGEACRDPRLKFVSRNAPTHETIEGARLRLEPEKGNHLTQRENFDSGRVIGLLIVESGAVEFRNGTVTGLDSVCLFVMGRYPSGNDPGMLRSTFIRRQSGVALEEVGTYVRIGKPHKEPDADWIVNYESPLERAGMLPIALWSAQDRIRMMTQGGCGGGCCSPKKQF